MTVNGKEYQGYIKICFEEIPRNCGECPIYKSHYTYDESYGFGNNEIHFCPFCDNMFGHYVERPSGCPIVEEVRKRSMAEIDADNFQ